MPAEGTPHKRKRLRGKGAWAAIAVLLVIGVWLYLDLQNPVRNPDEKPHIMDLLRLKPEQVTRLEVREGDKTLYAVARAGEQWRVEQPFQARGDKEKIEGLLRKLLDASISRELSASSQDAAKFGLDKPELEVILYAGRQQKMIRIGKADAEGSARYAQLTGQRRFFALPASEVNDLKGQKTAELRDLVLVAGDRDSIRRLAIRRPAAEAVLERKEQDQWELASPFRAKADKFEVSGVLDRLAPLRAASLVVENPPNLREYGLDQPSLTVAVTDRNGTHTVRFGKQAPPAKPSQPESAADEPGYYCMREGESAVFLLQSGDYDGLAKDSSELRDRTLLAFEDKQAERITITNPHGDLELHRRGEDWWLVRPENVRANQNKVVDLFASLRGTATRHVEENPPDLNRYGLANPAYRVNVWTSTGKTQQLSLGSRVPGEDAEYYAQTSESRAVFQVADTLKADLDLKPADLKPEEPKTTPPPANSAQKPPPSPKPARRR